MRTAKLHSRWLVQTAPSCASHTSQARAIHIRTFRALPSHTRTSSAAVLRVQTVNVPNPRVEKEEHYYNVKCSKLRDLGLEPHLLGDSMASSLLEFAMKYKERCNLELIQPAVDWKKAGARIATKNAAYAGR